MSAATPETPHEPSSPLLSKMRRVFLFGYTLFWAAQFWLQSQTFWHADRSGHHLSVIPPIIVIVGSALMGILGLCNIVFIRNPRSRFYLFRSMST